MQRAALGDTTPACPLFTEKKPYAEERHEDGKAEGAVKGQRRRAKHNHQKTDAKKPVKRRCGVCALGGVCVQRGAGRREE